jgi:hypothetical protein
MVVPHTALPDPEVRDDLREGLVLLGLELSRPSVMELLADCDTGPSDADALAGLLWCALRLRDRVLAEATDRALERALERSGSIAVARRLQAVLALRGRKYDLADERLLEAAQSEVDDPGAVAPSLSVLAALLVGMGQPGASYASLERVFNG